MTIEHYVTECFSPIDATSEDRDWRRVDAARSIPETATGGNLDEAEAKARELTRLLPDFHFGYYWLVRILEQKGRPDDARATGIEGLSKSKQKFALCEALAQVEIREGNLSNALMWWIRAIRLRTALKAFNDNAALLYVAFIAGELGLSELSQGCRILARSIRDTALSNEVCAELEGLLKNDDREQLKSALNRLTAELASYSANRSNR